MFKLTAKEITMKSKVVWQQSRYSCFLQHANRDELLDSQIAFYYAVEAFPCLLLKLASQIPEADARLLIVENIWEEHGQGQKAGFHTTTFNNHLRSLGFDGEYVKNPFLTQWLDALFAIDSINHLFQSLAAIEYIYAVISESISAKLAQLTLLDEQDHYLKHSHLDWSHGEDILIAMQLCGITFNAELFTEAQLTFINLFDKLALPTQSELLNIKATVPVNFYYSREDPSIIDAVLAQVTQTHLNVLTICSGGENVIKYDSHPAVANITAVDINPAQIELCLKKLRYGVKERKCDEQGKFEYLFALVRGYFINHRQQLTVVEDYATQDELLKYVIDKVFDNTVLSTLFTNEATQYSNGSFSEHFKLVYQKMLADINLPHINNANSNNVVLGLPINLQYQLSNKKEGYRADGQAYRDKDIRHISFINAPVNLGLFESKFDVIDLSNIGDWMPYAQFYALVLQAFKQLNEGGVLVLRRLLGDYSLSALNIGEITSLHDQTGFYSETVMVKK